MTTNSSTARQHQFRTRLTPQGAQYFSLAQRLAEEQLAHVRNHEWSVVIPRGGEEDETRYLSVDQDEFSWIGPVPDCPNCLNPLRHLGRATGQMAYVSDRSMEQTVLECYDCGEEWPLTECR